MSNFVFKLPDVGEGIAQAEIVAWHAEIGQDIKEDDPLIDVMTDKATVEISSPVSGRILSRQGEVGAMAAIGSEIVVIATVAKPEKAASNGKAAAPKPAPKPAAPPVEPTAPLPKAAETHSGKVLAAPAVRARMAALKLDPATLRGSGPDGRIEHADLDQALTQFGRPAVSSAKPDEVIEEVKIVGLRRQIAERMLESKRSIPHFSYVEEIDVTALETLRADLNGSEDGPRLTLLPFLIRAMIRAIAQHPGVNAHYDDEAGIIRRHGAVHIGVATQTPRGLVVPVIRHAETLSLRELASEIVRLSELARNGKASRELLTGSTITVSSLGPLGGIMATPIINPPEVAIVGVNKIVERPVVRGGQIAIAKLMNLSSSFDHRVVDGFDAAAFIKSVKAELEAPGRLIQAIP
ncbi:lipoamide acyltransferase component of branched-chain alpha-keto acid dehydrogenase complex [Labrys miyagiensis]|uniref:Dihydrolipoamide acetyltransferase component of pyruvate dehydrogenase complex n=1 Tax=Labrys miyagiensis TaxID=346912 RepID=A0ABQ6CFH2_9HYPH|nr:dihydrolipoamide acetyltransferase family protein [Labrys miyagiensis]GLS18969.1 lipoamide acyltransferase component of branched-chain alpha-keto acid dehydrogenase complex [Labrys miyagiensis]